MIVTIGLTGLTVLFCAGVIAGIATTVYARRLFQKFIKKSGV